MSQLKVISIIPGLEEGNSMLFSKNQVQSLIKNGVCSNTIYLKSRTSIPSLLKDFIHIRKEIKQFKPDILHVHYGSISAFICAMTLFRNFVITFHGSDLYYTKNIGLFRNIFNKFFSQLSILFAKAFICNNFKMTEKIWWCKDKVQVIPIGVDEQKFYPMDRNECRKMLGWGDEKVILFSGNNPIVKRLDIANSIIDLLSREFIGIRLEILDGKVAYSDIPKIINASDCLLVCSDSETGPIIVKESMSCNIPVVGVDVGDVKDMLESCDNSFLVERDVDKLADKINTVIRSNRKSLNARELIVSKGVTDDKTIERVLRLYKNLK